MSLAKGLLGIGTAVGVAAGSAFAVQTLSGEEFVPKTIDSEGDSAYTSKYGGSFLLHFVSTTATENKAWWDDVYEKLLKPDNGSGDAKAESDEFKKVKKGFGEASDETSLTKICKTAYEKTPAELKVSNQDKYVNDIWNFCSIEKTKLVLLTKASGSPSKIKDKHGDRLVSTEDSKNNKFWEIQEKAFFKNGNKQGLGQGATQGSTFKIFYGTGTKTNNKTLKEICKEAYEKTDTGAEETDALKFCGIREKEGS